MKYIDKMALMQQDFLDEQADIGRLATKKASYGKTGGDIGGLLGRFLGRMLIPIPVIGAAIGEGFGTWAGTETGDHFSGVKDDKLRRGRFFHDSRSSILDQINKNQKTQSLMGAARGGIADLAAVFPDKDSMARSFGVGGEEFADKVTKQGLLDNPWLEEEDDFFAEDLLNPSIDDWIQEPKMPWETELSPYGPFMQYQK